MKPTQLISAVLLVILIVTSGCQKDDSHSGTEHIQEIIPNTFADYFGNEISRDFIGTVIDKNHNPIEGVLIRIGDETASTDSNGVFIIKDAEVNERFGYIKAEKAGYIHGSRSVVPTEGTNKVQIMLLEANPITTINSGTSTTVSITDGSSVSFDGNFINEDGTEYSGPVEVIMYHLDPTDEAMDLQMPGMLYAENEDGAERMLQTLGMLAVELRGSGGEDLNLAEGSTSEIKIPVDESLMGSAPATIPLWYFDEANGYWKEDGEAILIGNMYVGTVSHFSFWTCSIIHLQHNTLSITIEDTYGNPLNNVKVALSSENLRTIYNYTNNSGIVSGLIPSNKSIEIDLSVEYLCDGNSILNQIVGPFNSDSSITIEIPESPEIFTEQISGSFYQCNGQQINEAYVFITHGSKVFVDNITDSVFNTSLLRCNEYNSFKIEAVDFNSYNSSGEINYNFTHPFTFIGNIYACDEIDEFIQYKVDNNEYIFLLDNIRADFFPDDISSNNNNPRLYIWSTENICFHLTGKINELNYTGSYDDLKWNITNDTGFNIYDCNESIQESISDINTNIIYNLNILGDVGEYIDINFSGSYEDSDGNPHTINGVIHVLRNY
ncbi:hypothetical protein [Winogradskyella sp.]|uniref:hypothetical protein n=1 Tax=Winogradskyella sp. TaxID=1883156 RepID=UPI003BA94FCB